MIDCSHGNSNKQPENQVRVIESIAQQLENGDTRIGGETEYTLSLNRNKRSIVLDLKTAQGQKAARHLATQCDVFVENFRPGTADRLGMGWDDLHAINLPFLGAH